MNLPLEKIGPILRKRRTEMGLRIHDLADEQISKSTISNAERGLPIVTEAMYEYLLEKLELTHSLQSMLEESEQQEKEAKEALLALESMISTDPEESLQKLQYIQHTYDIQKNTPLYALHTFLLGRCAFEQKKWEKSKTYLHEVVERTKQQSSLTSTNLFSACMNDLGRIAFYENQVEDALRYTTDGLAYLDNNGERTHYQFHLLLNKGIYLEKMREPERALEAIQELDREILKLSSIYEVLYIVHVDVIVQMHNMYASLYMELQMYQKALEYAKKAVQISRKNKYFRNLMNSQTYLGIIYANSGETQKAEKCFLDTLELEKRVEFDDHLPFAYVELGELYIKQKNWEKAETILKQALHISLRNEDFIHLIECTIKLGDCFVEQKKYEQAIPYYLKAEELILESGDLESENAVVINLGYCYKQLGDQSELEKYQRRALQVNTKIRWGK
jgi:tetratricopeptide (TPR) repeat protein